MSLYRRPASVARRTLAAAAVAAAVAGLVGGYVIGRATAPAPTLGERIAALRSALRPAQQGIELSGTEYGQAVRNGRTVAPTEYAAAQADVQRARDAVAGVQEDLRALHPGPTATLRAALDDLARAIDAKADPARVRRLSAAAARALGALGGASPGR